MKKKVTIYLSSVKEPDEFFKLEDAFGEKFSKKFLEFGEYATMELTVSEDGTFKGTFLK